MKISNLRIEHNVSFKYGKPQARIICDIDTRYTDHKELWFSVDEENYDWLTTDVYDAFMVAMLYPAMFYHEDMTIEGNVSRRIHHNIVSYIESCITDFEPKCKNIAIVSAGYADAEKASQLHIGTGFSGGVDSFSTLIDNYFNSKDDAYKIDTLFFFHVGQYGNVINEKTWLRARNRFSITENFANEAHLPGGAVLMSTNLFDFYQPNWEYDAGLFCRAASILVFEKVLRCYYVSNDYSYGELKRMDFGLGGECIAEYAEAWILPLLSTSSLEILSDGVQYKRSEKIRRLKDNQLAQKYLNVCVNTEDEHISAKNCSCCRKCLETQLALESAGALQNFSKVFDIDIYKRNIFKYKCLIVRRYGKNTFDTDNVDFARANGIKLPSKAIAYAEPIITRVCHIVNVLFTNPYRIIDKFRNKKN